MKSVLKYGYRCYAMNTLEPLVIELKRLILSQFSLLYSIHFESLCLYQSYLCGEHYSLRNNWLGNTQVDILVHCEQDRDILGRKSAKCSTNRKLYTNRTNRVKSFLNLLNLSKPSNQLLYLCLRRKLKVQTLYLKIHSLKLSPNLHSLKSSLKNLRKRYSSQRYSNKVLIIPKRQVFNSFFKKNKLIRKKHTSNYNQSFPFKVSL